MSRMIPLAALLSLAAGGALAQEQAEVAPGYTEQALRDAARSQFDVILPAALRPMPWRPRSASLARCCSSICASPRRGCSRARAATTSGWGRGCAAHLDGHGWQQGPRNAPTVYNSFFNAAQFWDGRAADLAEQAMGPVQAAVEMNNTPDQVVATLNSMDVYREAFAESFPEEPEPVSFENFATAVAQFEETLVTPGAAFDRWLTGDENALTEQQKRGLGLFMDAGCASCHGGVNFGGQDYYPFGVVERPGADVLPEGDRGRFQVTETAGDDYVFRAAPLRNVAITAPYFHSGAVWSLEEAVVIMANSQLGADLTEEEIDAITAFLQGLTGEQPQVVHPVLPPRTAETPLPDPF